MLVSRIRICLQLDRRKMRPADENAVWFYRDSFCPCFAAMSSAGPGARNAFPPGANMRRRYQRCQILSDSIFYSVFPNISPWRSFNRSSTGQADGDNPEQSLQ